MILLRSLLYPVFFFSGAAGLGYQIAWLRMFATGFGHELPATLAVVCAFMGGLGLGAWALDKAISRSEHPGRCYAMLEVTIGLWAFLSTIEIPLLNRAALQLLGVEPSALRHWTISFALPLLAILPATAAMGATLPAMERVVSSLAADARCVGAVYAANTLGAVAGTLLSAFVMVPALGLRRTVWCLGVINLLCGAAALVLGTTRSRPDDSTRTASSAMSLSTTISARRLGLTLFVTGFLGIGYEAVGVRVLSQVLENTVYTFAAVLSIFLLGTAIGAALYQRFVKRFNLHVLLPDLLCGLSLTALLGVLALSRAQLIYDASRSVFGDSQSGVWAAEMVVAAAVFGLPTIFMGAIFSHLVQAAKRKGGGVGRAAAMNTFGGALAPALFAVVLLPTIGSKWTLALVSLGYLALVPKVSGWRWGFLAAPLILFFALPTNLQLVQLPPGGKLAEYREGVMASVAVIEDAARNKTLRVNNRFQMGGTAAAEAESRHAHLPLLLHPAPRRALFLGLGTGITLGAASTHPDLLSDGVELVPEVVEVMPQFEPFNYAPSRNPALNLHVADARRFISATRTQYDVIVADLFHPARDGAGSLYTVEHFQAVRQRLLPGGLFCQWLPLHQLDEPTLQIIVRTFLEVFPDAQAYLLRFNVDAPVVGLMGSLAWPQYSAHWVEQRLVDPALEKQLKKLALADSVRLFGALIAAPTELRAFAGNALLNTDDQPRITFGAPRFTYQKNATSYGRLVALLEHPLDNVQEVLKLDSEAEANHFAARLKQYMRARDVYLKGLIEETEGHPARALDAFVESARLSEDFTPGYAQCLTIASLEAKADPDKARALLRRLAEAQPSRPVAAQMLKKLFGDR